VSPIIALVVGSALLALAVGLAALRRRPDPMAVPLALLMAAAVSWAVPHAISMAATGEAATLFWERMRYPATVLSPIAYFGFSVAYAGYDRWLSRRRLALLSAVPFVTVVLVWTNPFHGLFWASVSVTPVGGVTIVESVPGPWYWINLAYLYTVTLASLFVLGYTVVRSGPIYRKQAGLMFVGGAVPLSTNAVVNFGVGPAPMVDLTTSAMAVTGVTFALALFHFDLLEIRPVARDRLLEELADGVVVIGPEGRIRDFNRVADRVLGGLTVDQPADEVLPTDIAPDGGEIAAEVDGRRRLFRTRSTPLVDGRGEETGRIVYLNDTTEIVEREQRISVLNRVLRHNIRNELNVADGQLQTVVSDVEGADADRIREAREHIRHVTELAAKARDVERTLQGRDSAETASAAAVVERVVAEARSSFPAATLRSETGDADRVEVVDVELFETAIAELVENGVVHSGSETSTVIVVVGGGADRVEVRVTDDGPGVPEAERRALNARTESTLEHGSGLGLWLVQWTASLSAGDLSFEDDGRTVVLSLPAADGTGT